MNHNSIGGIAMSYSDALMSQLHLLDYWQHNPEESKFICKQLGDSFLPARALQQMMVNMLSQADTYYVSEEIADVLVGGFDTLPDTPLGDMRPSSPYGWVYFERPVLCPFPGPAGKPWKIKAVMWGPHSDEGLNICIFVAPTVGALQCSGMTKAIWSSSWDREWIAPHGAVWNRSGYADRELTNWIGKLVFSFFAFIRQECVSIQTTQASRPIRRHAPRAYTAEPVIRIIQLRRRGPAINGGETQSRDYSCRWLVRGHWRNQFYPSSKSHRPRFIPAYVKGPDDKPLKQPAKVSLFAVVR
jgi:hypothetical protein